MRSAKVFCLFLLIMLSVAISGCASKQGTTKKIAPSRVKSKPIEAKGSYDCAVQSAPQNKLPKESLPEFTVSSTKPADPF